MLTTTKLAQHMKVGVHGSTYGGNPLACAVAEAVVNFTQQADILAGVKQREQWLKQGLAKLNEKYDLFADIRGKGLLIGAELNQHWQGRARDILIAAGEHGLLLLVAGANVVRFTPSLVISKQEIEQGLQQLDNAIASLVKP